jgi:hypothetical protein
MENFKLNGGLSSVTRLNWPAKGDKLVCNKTELKHWFRSVIENCAKLEIGQTYTVKECNVASSWCEILLEELEGSFSLSVFDWKVC